MTIGRPWTFHVFVHLTDWYCQYRSWPHKESYIFVGSCPVSIVSSSRTIAQEEHFYIHKVVAEQVIEDLVKNANLPIHWVAHTVQKPLTNGQHTVGLLAKIPPLFDRSASWLKL